VYQLPNPETRQGYAPSVYNILNTLTLQTLMNISIHIYDKGRQRLRKRGNTHIKRWRWRKRKRRRAHSRVV